MLEVLRFWFTKDLVGSGGPGEYGNGQSPNRSIRNMLKGGRASHTIPPWGSFSGCVAAFEKTAS